MYNDNKYFYYTRRCIMKCLFLFTRRRIIVTNILLYKNTYNDNKYFYYTRRCIMSTNILLYKKMYNEMFVSIIQEDV